MSHGEIFVDRVASFLIEDVIESDRFQEGGMDGFNFLYYGVNYFICMI